MNLKQTFELILLFLFLTASASAIVTAQDAVNFISTNNFLTGNETVQIFPELKITHNNVQYWVAAVFSNNNIVGMIAVKASGSPEIMIFKSSNEQLFKTAMLLRNFLEAKENLAEKWFFTESNKGYYETLSRIMQSEKESDLTIILKEKIPTVSEKTQDLIVEASTIKTLSDSIAEKINKAIEKENEFYSKPSTQQFNSFLGFFESVKDDVDSLEKKIINYNSKVTALKIAIADSNVELQKKTALSNLAEQPTVLSASIAASKKQSANASIQAVSNAFSNSVSSAIAFAESFNSRSKKALAYNELYGEDKVLKQKTGFYSTLEFAVNDILSESKINEWKKQEEVLKLKNYWINAENAFKKASFDTAIEQAQKAKNSVVLIIKAGFKEPEPVEPEVNVDIFYQLAIGAIVILILLFFIQKILPKILKPNNGNSMQELQEEFKVRR